MSEVTEADLPVCAAEGRLIGSLRLTVLPHFQRAGLCLHKGKVPANALSLVQVEEGREYLYEWIGPQDSVFMEPAEVFLPDSASGKRGRLRTGLNTGLLQVQVQLNGIWEGGLELEVRSRKLDYLSEYQWMLRDIASWMAELVMSRFAPSGMMFTLDPGRDSATLYQRFAFLQSLLSSEGFGRAYAEITQRPHVAWEDQEEHCRLGQPTKAGSHLTREVTRAGPRAVCSFGLLSSAPLMLRNRRTEVTGDTTPNRFVRFALERWQSTVYEISQRLQDQDDSASIRRGLRDVATLLETLNRLLSHPALSDVGRLARFPAENQVLQRRAGYRELYRSYLEFDLAARLSWTSNETEYFAGQRDVAELYEYWAFIELARIVGSIVGEAFDLSPLMKQTADGLDVLLKKGREVDLSGSVLRHGQRLHLRLYFNKTYSTKNGGAWTRELRPDYSLLITPESGVNPDLEPVVLHFDAKYRVVAPEEVVGIPAAENEKPSKGGTPIPEDLLKMHTYRDAIRRTAGAYVLYPGDPRIRTDFNEYTELLPGLGAFALRPSVEGEPLGAATIQRFITDVLDHLSTRLTRHERSRYWLQQTYGEYDVALAKEESNGVDPAEETSVLLGYVPDEAHWLWIRERSTYNVRAAGRPGGISDATGLLYSRLLLLYGPVLRRPLLVQIVSDPQKLDEAAMAATQYPRPKGEYWCVQIAPTKQQPVIQALNCPGVEEFAVRRSSLLGAPVVASWRELLHLAPRS